MKIVDANVILRYLLNDHTEMSIRAADILENNEIYVPTEVIAEVVYVLEKVYRVTSADISNSLQKLIGSCKIKLVDKEVIIAALKLYSEQKLDFVDTILCSYAKVRNYEVHSFDKKLNQLLK